MVLWVTLGLAGAGAVVMIGLLLASSSGWSPASLAAELPAGEMLLIIDLDARHESDEKPAPILSCDHIEGVLDSKMMEIFPAGQRGVLAAVRRGPEGRSDVFIYQPKSLDERAFLHLLADSGFEKVKDTPIELWRPKGKEDYSVALKGGRIYHGDADLVADVAMGRFGPERTFAGQEECMGLVRQLSRSPGVLVVMKCNGANATTGLAHIMGKARWLATEETFSGDRGTIRMLLLFEREETAIEALGELRSDRQGAETDLLKGFKDQGWKFEGVDYGRRGAVLAMTATGRKGAEGTPGTSRPQQPQPYLKEPLKKAL